MILGYLTPKLGYVSPIQKMFGLRVRFFADEPAPSWIDTLPEETRGTIPPEYTKDPEVTKYKDLPEFLKGYKNKTELLGRKGIIIPKDGDAPEIIQKYRETMGIPEKPEGYKFKAPDKLHPELKVSPEFENSFKARMHAKGVPQSQAESLYHDFLSEVSASMVKRDEQTEKTRLEGITKLNQEWGKDTDSNIALARKAAIKVLGEDGYRSLGDFANNPQAVKLLHGLTKMLSEDAITSIGGVEQANSQSADKEIKNIMTLSKDDRAKHPFWDENHPKHNEEVKRVRELYRKREGSNAA